MTRRDALSIGGGLVVGAAAASAVFLATSHGAGTVTETTTKTTGGGMTTTITSAGSGVTTTVTTTTTSTEISSTVGTPQGNYIATSEGWSIGFCEPMIASVPDAAAMFNCNFKVVGSPAYNDTATFAAIESAIATKPDGMTMSLAPTVYKYVQEAMSDGIPVISYCVDDANSLNAPHPSGRMAYVGTDQYTLSYTMAKDVLPAIQALNPPSGAPVGIFIQRPGAPDLETRAQGYKDILVPAGFTCTEHLAGPDNTDESTSQVSAWLTANPNTIALFGCDGISTPGVTNALKNLGLGGKVIGAGYDLLLENLVGINSGNLYAACNQQPYIEWPQAVFTLLTYKQSNGLIYPWNSLTGSGVVTTANVAQFYNNRASKYVGATTMNPWTPTVTTST